MPARRSPARKDTKRFCKGIDGRPHTPTLTLVSWYGHFPCGWIPRLQKTDGQWRYVVAWKCSHQETCATCGKVLRRTSKLDVTECPLYPGDDSQKAHAVTQALDWQDRYNDRPSRRPPVTGPQHYRRRR